MTSLSPTAAIQFHFDERVALLKLIKGRFGFDNIHRGVQHNFTFSSRAVNQRINAASV